MKLFLKVDLYIWHNSCIGYLDISSTIFKWKIETRYGLELDRSWIEFI
jgi:hypothetical protein